LRCKNEPPLAKYQDPFTVGSPFKGGPDRRRTGNTNRALYFFSVTNFYRISKNSFLFQARDDGGPSSGAISMRAMALATLRFMREEENR
jgi:hypothetical protein